MLLTSVFCVRWAINSFAEIWTTRALRMAHSNCGKRIKLSFVDLNCNIDEYHTGVFQFKWAVSQYKNFKNPLRIDEFMYNFVTKLETT